MKAVIPTISDLRHSRKTTHSRDQVALYSYWTTWTVLAMTLNEYVVPCCHLPIKATFYI